MNSRGAKVAALVAAAFVIVGLLGTLGVLSGAIQPGPRASSALPTATPAAATSPSPTTAAADRFGYVFTAQEERIVVRRERDAAPVSMQGATSPIPGPPVFELAGVQPAVSTDGKRLAYWRTTPNVGDPSGPTTVANDLRVLEVANPASDRSVLTLTGQTVGGGVVWSNDGQGLLVVTQSREMLGHCFAQSTVVMLDLATTPPAARAATESGSSACVYLPVAWDRPGQVAAAITTGPGGVATDYVTWNGNAANPLARAPVPREIYTPDVQASADAKLVLGLDRNANALRVWPILDITKAEEVRHPLRIASAIWRPGATAPYEVIWTVGFRVDLFQYRTDSSTTLYTSTESDVGIAAVRPDGSGVLITQSSGGLPPSTTRLLVVDVTTRRTTEISTTVGGVHPLSRGVLLR